MVIWKLELDLKYILEIIPETYSTVLNYEVSSWSRFEERGLASSKSDPEVISKYFLLELKCL